MNFELLKAVQLGEHTDSATICCVGNSIRLIHALSH